MTGQALTSENKPIEPDSKILPGRIARNIAWVVSGEFVARVIGFGVFVFLARLVGAAGFGALGSALALVSYFQTAVNWGLDPYATRDTAQNNDSLPSVYARITGARLLLAAIGSLLILASLLFLPERLTQHADLIVIYGLILFTEALAAQWAIQGLEEMKLIAVGTVAQHVIMAAGIVLLLPGREDSLWLVPTVHVASLFAMQGWFYSRLRARFTSLHPSFDWRKTIGALRDSMPVAFAKILRQSYYQGGVLLLALIASDADAGAFFASQRLILVGVVVGTIYQMNAYPTISRISRRDPAAAVRFQSNVLRHGLILLTPAIVIGTWYAEPLILLVFGPEFFETSQIFFVMLFSIPVFTFNMGMQNLLLAVSLGRHHFIGTTIAALSHIALAIILIPRLSGVGAAWACLAGEILCALYLIIVVRRKFGAIPLQYRMMSPLIGGGFMATSLAFTTSFPLYAQVGLAALAYCLTALLLGSLRENEISYVSATLRNLPRKPSQSV